MWNGNTLSNGDSLPILDVGSEETREIPATSLICVTTAVNSQCCRGSDGGAVGDWFYPNGTMVPRRRGAPGSSAFTRTGFAQQVRLNSRARIRPDIFGLYTCVVPDVNGTSVSASINLSK